MAPYFPFPPGEVCHDELGMAAALTIMVIADKAYAVSEGYEPPQRELTERWSDGLSAAVEAFNAKSAETHHAVASWWTLHHDETADNA